MRYSLKRRAGGLLCGVLIFCQIWTMTAFARPDWPADTGIMAEAGVVMDVDSGAVIFSQNGHVAYPPASITKILTALIVLEHASLDETVTYSETAMNSVEADSGNKLSLAVGDQLTVEECLYALLLVSSNQTANALAEHVAGSISAFVDMMNAKLTELGCTESHFDNPSGLNGDTQAVSALDMAKIAQAAYQNETLLAINSADSYRIDSTINNPDGVTAVNEHRLVVTEDSSSEFYYPSAKAGKTGYLLAAGNTLVTYAEQDGRRLVSVILKGSPRQYFLDGKNLLEFGFGSFQNMGINENETRYVTGTEPVELNGVSYQPEELVIEPGKVITLPDSAAFSDSELTLEAAPEGAPSGTVGRLSYTYNDRQIGSALLLTQEGAQALAAGAGTDDSAQGETDGTETAGAQDGGTENAEDGSGSTDETGTGDVPEDTGAGDAGTETQNGSGTDELSETVSGPADGQTADAENQDGGVNLAVVFLLVLFAGLAGFAFYWLHQKQKREAEESALRRRERRRRIIEEGAETEAEYERLLEEKRLREEKKRRRP